MFWVLASIFFSVATAANGPGTSEPITRIAFGSCNMHDAPQPLWDPIRAFQPQLWIWLGDVVYADTRFGLFDWRPSPLEVMQQKYLAQTQLPGYQKLKDVCPVVGVWDDHDFGNNNGGNEYANRSQSQQLFLDFIGAPADSPLRTRPGLYTSYELGPPGRKVKVILLDLRYFRDPVPTGRYGGEFLGESQWKWLEKELQESDADLHIIGSSIQLIPVDKLIIEKWANFPAARDRFLRLLRETVPRNSIILSGDVHYGELLEMDLCSPGKPNSVLSAAHDAVPLFEITSSGMTHAVNFNSPFNLGMQLLRLFKSRSQIPAQRAAVGAHRRVHASGFYGDLNFGTLEIFWDAEPPYVSMAVRGVDGQEALLHRVNFSKSKVPQSCDAPFDDVSLHWNPYLIPFEVYQSAFFTCKYSLTFGVPLVFLVVFLYKLCLAYRKRNKID